MLGQPTPDADRDRENTRKRESPDLTGGVPNDLSAREAARLLGLHERTVRRAIRGGELTATKQGGSFHINKIGGSQALPAASRATAPA